MGSNQLIYNISDDRTDDGSGKENLEGWTRLGLVHPGQHCLTWCMVTGTGVQLDRRNAL